jgi:hypothetical protein
MGANYPLERIPLHAQPMRSSGAKRSKNPPRRAVNDMSENYKWARLIELGNGKTVLVIKEEAEDEDSEAPYQVKVICDFEGARGNIALGFRDEAKRDECFKEYSLEQASSVYDSIAEMFSVE